MLIVEQRPRRNWYGYPSQEMSGSLPTTLYKYLPRRYAEAMIERGKLMFSSLAWFQNYEDEQRGDRFEGYSVEFFDMTGHGRSDLSPHERTTSSNAG